MTKYIPIMAILLLTACTAGHDMQGVDPNDYYAGHPIKNTIEAHTVVAKAHFMANATSLSDNESDRLAKLLHGISPLAVQSIRIQMAQSDLRNEARKNALVTLLRHKGYAPDVVSFEAAPALERGDIQMNIDYLSVVAPDCPDWRTSPVTSYSNTTQGNFYCANEVNIGAMIADPHDLVRGTGDVPFDSERDSKVIEDYRSGKDFSVGFPTNGSVGSSTNSSSNSSSSTSTTTATPSSGGAPPSSP